MTKKEILDTLKHVKDDEEIPEGARITIYNNLRAIYTKQDAVQLLKDEYGNVQERRINDIADVVAERFVDGNYDCNLSYWDNLRNLINEYLL